MKQYRIESGKPSYHQSQAGFSYAATLIVTLSHSGLLRHLAAIDKRGEPYKVVEVKTSPKWVENL